MYKIFGGISFLVCALCILICFLLLCRFKYNIKKTVIITSVVMIPVIIFNLLFEILFDINIVPKFFIFTFLLPCFLLFFLINKDKNEKFIFTFFLIEIVNFWTFSLINIIDHYCLNKGYTIFLLRIILFPCIVFFVYKYGRKPYKKLLENVSCGWGTFAVFTMFLYAIILYTAFWPKIIWERPSDLPVFILFMILVPLSYYTMFFILKNQYLLFSEKELSHELKAQNNLLELQLDKKEDLRRIRHDLKAHINTLSFLIDDKKYDQAKEYLDNILNSSVIKSQVEQFEYCDNAYIDSLLSFYKTKFKSIKAEYSVDFLNTFNEAIPVTTFCLVLSNALDNAFEAVSLCEEKKVFVKIKKRGMYILVRIANSCKKDLYIKKGDVPVSTKNIKGHGYGIPTIIEKAEELGGGAICYAEKGKFVIDMFFKTSKQQGM